ncbi:hypothetical protein DCAR_0102449 [Daucus carota subsp. sativus]|uniref:Uncharacterized protein n=1 Tax=Daucus carota subsp. sativus TaxID=79200 RepID=A0A166H4D3_DAUCS|nr:PREDICTED: basic proline-rich protein-like [Daucus carota subsp. sativus]WOG83274.1 hypothetical protein DCAR_0102449 [Daucus carota subsp. sativus]
MSTLAMSSAIVKLTSYTPKITLKNITARTAPMASSARMIQSGSPPEFPKKPEIKPHTPTELPVTPNYPDFGPVPPEEFPKPSLEPSGPDFPVPPTPSPPVPDAPKPPMPSPPGPDIPLGPPPPNVFPPNDPDVIPMGPPEVEPPQRTPPDIPTPTM